MHIERTQTVFCIFSVVSFCQTLSATRTFKIPKVNVQTCRNEQVVLSGLTMKGLHDWVLRLEPKINAVKWFLLKLTCWLCVFLPHFSGQQSASCLWETVENVPRVWLSRLARIRWSLELVNEVQMLLEKQGTGRNCVFMAAFCGRGKTTADLSKRWPGTRFSKVPKSFRTRKPVAKI